MFICLGYCEDDASGSKAVITLLKQLQNKSVHLFWSIHWNCDHRQHWHVQMSDWLPTCQIQQPGPRSWCCRSGGRSTCRTLCPETRVWSPGHQCEDLFVLKIFYVGTICNATDITNNNYDHNYNLFLKLTQEFQCLQQIQQQTTPAHGFTLARNIQPTPSSK